MRARNIKPGFFKDEDLVECSIPARLLATGLWMLADRDGRLIDKPRQIKMEIFPADNIDIEQLLSELHLHKHIIRYEIDGLKYIQIRGFTKHQSPHFTEKPSLIPPSILDDFQKKASSSQDIPKALPPDSLIPDSLIPDSLIPDSSPVGEDAPAKVSRMPFAELPFDWKVWTINEKGWDDSIISDVWEVFREHWRNGKGRNTKRESWVGTWHNWCRKENFHSKNNGANHGRPTKLDLIAEGVRRARAQREQESSAQAG